MKEITVSKCSECPLHTLDGGIAFCNLDDGPRYDEVNDAWNRENIPGSCPLQTSSILIRGPK
jgi:hypothetical protein